MSLQRRKPLRCKPEKVLAWKRRSSKPLPKKGKKGKAWDKAKKDVDAEAVEAGAMSCELRYPGCTGSMFLTRAHSKKRRNITSEEELRECIMACVSCHEIIERKPESEMCDIVRKVRKNRLRI